MHRTTNECELALGDVHIFVVVVVGYPYLAWDCLELPFKVKNSKNKRKWLSKFPCHINTKSKSLAKSREKMSGTLREKSQRYVVFSLNYLNKSLRRFSVSPSTQA